MRRPRAPIALPAIAAALIVLGFIASRVIPTMVTEQQLATNVLLSAIPFILIFVGILLLYITLIVLVASALNGLVAPRVYTIITRVLAYILWSHVTPAFEDVQEEARGGSVTSNA
jgi:hypothetical protein